MTDTFFPDLSEFQPNADFAGIRKLTDAVSVRLAYGARSDRTMPARISAVRAQHFDAVVWYIFLRPGTSVPVTMQFQAVRSLLPLLDRGECIAVDWEADTDKQVPTTTDRDALLTMLNNYYGVNDLLYGSASSLATYSGASPLWVASYGVSTEPRVRHAFWQYTDGKYSSAGYAPMNWPGAGKCDTSVFHGTSQELAALFSNQKVHVRMTLNKPIAGILPTKTGQGYWLYAQDGGIFAFGDAQSFTDSLPAQPLSAPVVGGAVTPTGAGLWLTAADGGVFAFGDAVFKGSIPGLASA